MKRSQYGSLGGHPSRIGSRILFGGLANWLSRGISIVLGLVLMPILFRKLPKEELGVWLLLAQSWAGLGVFDLGFGIVVTRRIAFAAGRVSQNGKRDFAFKGFEEVSNIVATAQGVYRCLALVSLVLSLASGLWYLRNLELTQVSWITTWSAWCILCLSQAVGIWAAPWTCLLQGAGYVGWDNIVASVVNSATVLTQIALLGLGGGVVSLAITGAAGTLCQRWLVVQFVRRCRYNIASHPGHWSSACFRTMLPQAIRAWLTSLGYLLVANTDQFFITAHKGAAAIPAYRAAFLLMINLHLLAGVFSAASPVFVSQLWQKGNLAEIRAILKRNAQIGLMAMVCGGGAILALGPVLFEVWLGPGNFIGYPVLGIFLATFVLEHHANVFSGCGRATDDEAYAGWSIAGGLLKLIFACLLTAWFGLPGLALSTLLAQGVTNDWFMVYRSAKRLGVKWSQHTRSVLIPVIVLFVTVGGLGAVLIEELANQQPRIRMAAVISLAAIALGCSLWGIVLNSRERKRLLLRAGFDTARSPGVTCLL